MTIKSSVPGRHDNHVTYRSRKRSPRKMKHRILLIKMDEGWCWVYCVGLSHKARSYRYYPSLAHATISAVNFRKLLVYDNECEIVPPEGHVYSGG